MSTARTCFALMLVATALSGARAVNIIMKEVCPKEMAKLNCPSLKQAMQSGDYSELIWKVTDPRKESENEQKLGYCDENLSCTRYTNLGNFENRIKIRNDPVKGVLNVEQLIKDDLLTFTCYVQRKQNKDPLVYQVNMSSSVTCLSLTANQDVNLNEALKEMPSKDYIRDMWWYWIRIDGEMQKILYCNSRSCVFEDCKSTCPKCRPRLKIKGVTLVLMDVKEEDRGLLLQCRIFPKLMGRMVSELSVQVYTIKISAVLPKDSFSSTSLSKNTEMPSTWNSQMPSKTTKNSSAGAYGTQSSASSRNLLAFTSVLISWILAVLGIS